MRKLSTKFMEVDNAENWIRILEIDEIGALHVRAWCFYYEVSARTFYTRRKLYQDYLKEHDIGSFAELNIMIRKDPSLIEKINIQGVNENVNESDRPGYVTVSLDNNTPEVIDCSYKVKDSTSTSGVSITHNDLTVNVSDEFKEQTLARVLKVIQNA